MSLAPRVRPLWLLMLALLGCDGGPSGPNGPALRVTVMGLPGGAGADITVSGPDGYSQAVTSSQNLTQLTPGIYTVSAASVPVGTAQYNPTPVSQTVAVTAQANATITYHQVTGGLTVSISGLGTNSTAAVTVTGPGYSQDVPSTRTLTGLNPGSYTITARDTVAGGGTPHTASPGTQTVSVFAQLTATASVSYSPPPADGSVNLSIAGMYLTQSTQTYNGAVPLVTNRDGYLRVFVVADRGNSATPAVKVRFLSGITPVDSATIVAPRLSVPTSVQEDTLAYTWNMLVPGTLIQPNLAIQAEVDPTGTVAEINEADNVYPSTTPLAMDVRTVPAVDVTFVPILQKGLPLSRRRGNISEANKAQFLQASQRMHPISTFNAVVHQDYTTTTSDTLQAQNGNGAWGTILTEIDALRITEHSPRYFYGVARVSYLSGVAGVAYVSTSTQGGRAALGWDYMPSGAQIAAHELGHNWARNHSPCGGPAGVDPQYPHSDGRTGNYGLEVATATLEPPTLNDIMGYCDPKWISEYTYQGVMNYLMNPSPPLLSVQSQAIQPSLLVWGHIRNGEIVLEPAFQVNTRPTLPDRGGPYLLTGQAADGSTLFSHSFSPSEIADAGQSQQSFAFAVPLPDARAARLTRIQVAGKGQLKVLSAAAQPPATAEPVEARRMGGGRVALRWNSQTHPMVLVRDPATGQVLSFARGGDVQLSTLKDQIELVMSNGITSQVKRMRVAP